MAIIDFLKKTKRGNMGYDPQLPPMDKDLQDSEDSLMGKRVMLPQRAAPARFASTGRNLAMEGAMARDTQGTGTVFAPGQGRQVARAMDLGNGQYAFSTNAVAPRVSEPAAAMAPTPTPTPTAVDRNGDGIPDGAEVVHTSTEADGVMTKRTQAKWTHKAPTRFEMPIPVDRTGDRFGAMREGLGQLAHGNTADKRFASAREQARRGDPGALSFSRELALKRAENVEPNQVMAGSNETVAGIHAKEGVEVAGVQAGGVMGAAATKAQTEEAIARGVAGTEAAKLGQQAAEFKAKFDQGVQFSKDPASGASVASFNGQMLQMKEDTDPTQPTELWSTDPADPNKRKFFGYWDKKNGFGTERPAAAPAPMSAYDSFLASKSAKGGQDAPTLSPEDASALPPGTQYRGSDGKLRVR